MEPCPAKETTCVMCSWMSVNCDWERFLDHSLRVVLDGFISREDSMKARVPQGSFFGPRLFLIYINEMGDSLASHHIANDTTTHSAIPKTQKPNTSLSFPTDGSIKIEMWSDTWMINVNESKTKKLLINWSKMPCEHPSFICKKETAKLTSFVYWGSISSLLSLGITTLIGWEPPAQENS